MLQVLFLPYTSVVQSEVKKWHPRPNVLYTRISHAEQAAFRSAAEHAGVKVSQWARQQLRLAAIENLRSAGEKVPFLEEVVGE